MQKNIKANLDKENPFIGELFGFTPKFLVGANKGFR
jgi:hypothetical protein